MIELTLQFGDLVMANIEVIVNSTRRRVKLRARVIGFSDEAMLVSLLDDEPLLCGQQIPIPIMHVPFAVTKIAPPPVKPTP